MSKKFKPPSKVYILALLLAQILAAIVVRVSDISMLKPYSHILEWISILFVPVMLTIVLLLCVMTILENSRGENDRKLNSKLYEFSLVFICFFLAAYTIKVFEVKEVIVTYITMVIIIVFAKLVLNLIDKLDELWKRVCYEACCLASYITVGASVMYALVDHHLIKLPEFQPEWCAYSIVFFGVLAFGVIRHKYIYGE